MESWRKDPAKKELRRVILKNRRGLSAQEREHYSRQIFQRVLAETFYQQARRVFIYVSLAEEVATRDFLVHILQTGKQLYVPYIAGPGHMEAVRIRSLEDLAPGAFDIVTVKEPVQSADFAAENLDLVLTPGAAFSRDGRRLGMGGGYYDRFFLRVPKAFRAGLAFSCQLMDGIPQLAHDARMQAVVTERECMFCKDF